MPGRSHTVGRAHVGTGEIAHEWAFRLADFIELEDDAGRPVVLTVDKPLTAHGQRLCDSLGVQVRVVTVADGYAAQDFRSSVVRAHRRADAGDETLEICAHCGCEVDVDPAPHTPGCRGAGGARSTTGPVLADLKLNESNRASKPVILPGTPIRHANGLDALERMDAGEPQEPDLGDLELDDEPVLEEEEPTAREALSTTALPTTELGIGSPADVVPSESREPAGTEPASSSSSTWSRKRRTREEVIEAIQRFAVEHGRPPAISDFSGNRDYPSYGAAARLFGSWADAVVAAGFDRPTKVRRDVATREAAIDALQTVAAELGRVPTSGEAGLGIPGMFAVRRLFGTWSDYVEAAGFPRPSRGRQAGSKNRLTRSSHANRMQEPASEPAVELVAGPDLHAESMAASEERETPRVGPDGSRSSGTDDLLGAAGATMQAISAALGHLEKPERREVWEFIRPLIDEALT